MSFTTIHFDASDYCGDDFDARRVKLWATNNAEDETIHDPDGHVYIGSGNGTIAADGQASITVPVPEAGWNPITCQTTLHLDYPDRNSRARNGRETKTFGPFTVPEGNISGLITNVALTSNVASLTTSAAHGLRVGYTVTVSGDSAPFNGTHVITEVTSTVTFKCVIVAANVASRAAAALFTSNDIQLNDLVEEQTVPPEYAGALVAQLEAIRDEALAGGGGSLTVVSGGTVDLDDTKADGYLIGYKVTATTTIEGVSFEVGSYIFERDSSVYGGWTYRTLDVGEGVVPAPEAVAPTAGTLASSAITDTTFTLTVSGASDETALHASPYAFSTDDGGSWTAYQTSPIYAVTGLTGSTGYQCKHRVRDAAGNVSTGTAITVTTTAASLAPGDVATLFFDYDASTGATLYASETNISQIADASGSARHLVAAASGTAPNQVTLNGKDAAQFTPANSDRLRYVGSFTLAASAGYTICWVGRIDTFITNAHIFRTIGALLQMSSAGSLFAGSNTASAATPADLVAGDTHLIAVTVTASNVTVRVMGHKVTSSTGTTIDATNNIAIGANYSGGGSDFGAITHGRMWAYAQTITDGEFAGLRSWAQTEWGVE
jgi:hypothetical protein